MERGKYFGETEEKPENHRKEWTDKEIKKLKRLYNKHSSKYGVHKWKEVAKGLERTVGSVQTKYSEEFSDKTFKRRKITDWIAFNQVTGNTQKCSYCKENLSKGEIGISIREKVDSSAGQYNVWVHLGCIEDFLETISEAWEENKEELIEKAVMESI